MESNCDYCHLIILPTSSCKGKKLNILNSILTFSHNNYHHFCQNFVVFFYLFLLNYVRNFSMKQRLSNFSLHITYSIGVSKKCPLEAWNICRGTRRKQLLHSGFIFITSSLLTPEHCILMTRESRPKIQFLQRKYSPKPFKSAKLNSKNVHLLFH